MSSSRKNKQINQKNQIRKINDFEIADINIAVHQSNFQYEKLLNIFLEMIVWKNYSSTVNLGQAITDLKNGTEELLRKIKIINDKLNEYKDHYFDCNFTILKIKAQILYGKILFSISGRPGQEKILEVSKKTLNFSIDSELKSALENEKFKYDSDYHFQAEVNSAYRLLEGFGGPEFSKSNKSIFETIYKFALNCSDSIIKLELLHEKVLNIYMYEANSSPAKKKWVCDKFKDTYKVVIDKTREEIEKNKVTIQLLNAFVKANCLAVKIKNLTHPRAIFKFNPKSKDFFSVKEISADISTADFCDFFKTWEDSYKEFIQPTFEVLKNLNENLLNENPKWMTKESKNELYNSLSLLRVTLAFHFQLFFMCFSDPKFNFLEFSEFMNKITLEMNKLKENILSVCGFQNCVNHSLDLLLFFDLSSEEECLKGYQRKCEENADSRSKEIAESAAKALEMTSTLLKEADDLEKAKIEKAEKRVVSPSENEVVMPNESLPDTKNEISEPVVTEECEMLSVLQELDYDAIHLGNSLSKKMDEILGTLSRRLASYKFLCSNEIEFLFNSVKEIIIQYAHLISLNEKNKKLSLEEEIISKPEIQEGLQIGQEDISKLIQIINEKINESFENLAKIEKANLESKANHKLGLGKKVAKNKGMMNVNEEKLMELGEKKYIKNSIKVRMHRGDSSTPYGEERAFLRGIKDYQICLERTQYKWKLLSGYSVSTLEPNSLFKNEPGKKPHKQITDSDYQIMLGELFKEQYFKTKNRCFLEEALNHYQKVLPVFNLTNQFYFQAKTLESIASIKEILLQPFNEDSLREILTDYQSALSAFEKSIDDVTNGKKAKKQLNPIKVKIKQMEVDLEKLQLALRPRKINL